MLNRISVGHMVGRGFATSNAHAFIILLVLVAVLPAALMSVPVAGFFVFTLLVTTTALVLGLERAGSAFVVLGFGTVPLNDFTVSGAESFVELCDVFFLTGFLLLVPRLAGAAARIPTAFMVGGSVMLTAGTLSAVISDQPEFNFRILFVIGLGVVVLTILMVRWQPGLRATMAAVAAYMLGNAVNVAVSVVKGPISEGRYTGLTTHPNVMGVSAVLALTLAPFLWGTVPKRHRWIVGLGAFISLYGVWISGSRAALLSAIVLTLLYPLFKRSIPVALAVAGLSLPAIVVVDGTRQNPDSSNALGRLLGGGSARESDEARADGAQTGFDQFLSHPLLGDGWFTVWEAHNVYIQIAAAIGVFGLLGYVAMLMPILRPLIAVRAPYGLLAAPALAAAMIGLVDPALGSRYIWCVAALALSAGRLAAIAEGSADQVEAAEVNPRRIVRSVAQNPGGARHRARDTSAESPAAGR